ncbi:MAG: hypothetical protein HBSIN02_22900 [Bacteroidia bacterium]|nr:MAG: hypothetical protein HBSIN02_22900 [Bacteroidia bacterium]
MIQSYMGALPAVALVTMSLSVASAQVSEVWSRSYNGSGNGFDQIYAMTIDGAGNVYVTGSTYSGGATGVDMATIKYNPDGDSLWVRKYNGPGNSTDIGRSIAVDADGSVFVTGESRSGSSSGTEDFLTIKYLANGDTAWTRRYDGLGGLGDFPAGLALDDSGNVYVTGGSNSGASGNDIIVVKYNNDGVEQWVSRFEGTATFGFSDYSYGIAVDPVTGNAHVVGHADNLNTFWDLTTLKYDRYGTKVWHRTYAGPVNNVSEKGEAITIDAAGNVYITGSSNGTNSSTDIVTIKYSADGTEQWTRRFDRNQLIDDPFAIAVDPAGNVLVGGESGNDYVLIKYSPSGDSLWARWYNGTANLTDQVYAIAVDGDGDIYVTGRSGGNGSSYDIVTIKYTAAGDSVWGVRFNGTGSFNDEATAIKIDHLGHIYVAGMSTGTGESGNFHLVKYMESTPTSVSDGRIAGPSDFVLLQNYPNPFNGITSFDIRLTQRGRIDLKVFDSLGRVVATVVNGLHEAGVHRFRWNSGDAPSGTYWYRLIVGEKSETRSMVLIK